ncbi:uncharacterized protein DDB_G0271670-like [Impatiens glandulifera]|uniref:uncharacterized protein DDB_G0271670-like n=1 Tax=Impatiens glandulifera TaxID=253017 RepID=UPI001FB06280|nr:uncharacterized protein DDB_G0271670-like [Impatiens glandulifera]
MAVDEIVHDDLDDGSMQCTNHPYKNNINQGGICAFCLQEKLGKLVSSSFPIAVFPSSSTSSSPSFRSDVDASVSASIRLQPSTRNDFNEKTTTNNNDSHFHFSSSSSSRRTRMPSFLLTQRKKNKNLIPGPSHSSGVVYSRSKSTTTPGRGRGGGRGINPNDSIDTPSRRGFWSFLYYSKQTNKSADNPCNEICRAPEKATASVSNPSLTQRRDSSFIVVEENESPDATPFDRKVSRSRSVGCGSRSFSGDFFERLSTGFGDCTLRRVESQREGKAKSRSRQDSIKERVKCGGIFSGFMLAGSSSSSSNSYLVSSSSSSTEGGVRNVKGKVTSGGMGHHHLSHGRSRSWGWAFASPMRALGKPAAASSSSSSLYPSIKRSEASSIPIPNKNNTTPNLNAIPSLLAVRG